MIRVERRFTRPWWVMLFIGIWLIGSCLAGGLMMSLHMPLRAAPTEGAGLLLRDLNPTPRPGWHLVHLLSTDCACSQKLADYLISRHPLPNVSETVLVVGPDHTLTRRLLEHGWDVRTNQADNLRQRYGIRSIPALLVANPQHQIVYTGGYADRPNPQRGYRDLTILSQSQQGQRVSPYPIFGCSLGRQARAAADPLSLKY